MELLPVDCWQTDSLYSKLSSGWCAVSFFFFFFNLSDKCKPIFIVLIAFLSAKDIVLLAVQEIVALQVTVITLTFLLALQIEIDNNKISRICECCKTICSDILKAGLQRSYLLLY